MSSQVILTMAMKPFPKTTATMAIDPFPKTTLVMESFLEMIVMMNSFLEISLVTCF